LGPARVWEASYKKGDETMNEKELSIVKALQSKKLRVSAGNRWLMWDENNDKWIVYEHKKYSRKTTVVGRTVFENLAVRWLLEQEVE
jgi:hypothetical protein